MAVVAMLKTKGLVDCAELSRSLPAGSWLELNRGSEYNRPPPFFLDQNENAEEEKAALEEMLKNTSCPARSIGAFWLENAYVCGQGTVVTCDKNLVTDSAAEFINHGLAPDGFVKVIDGFETAPATELVLFSGVSFIVKRPWYRNFGHWLVDLMPLLAIAAFYKLKVERIIFGDVSSPQLLEIMKRTAGSLFPNAECIFVPDNHLCKCEALLYISPVHIPPLYKSTFAIDLMINISRELYSAPSKGGDLKIYVSRQNTAARKIVNELELSALLTANGFTTVFPETLGFGEQIRLFSQAEAVVGVKGAGLTTAAFCPPAANILVLSPAGFIDPFFWDLLSPRGLKYSEVFCKTAGGSSISMRDVHINCEKIAIYLKNLKN